MCVSVTMMDLRARFIIKRSACGREIFFNVVREILMLESGRIINGRESGV